MLSVWSLKYPPPPCSDENWHYHGSISFALVFWYLLVISYWTILVSDVNASQFSAQRNPQLHVSFQFCMYLLSCIIQVWKPLFLPCLAVPSLMFSAVSQLHVVTFALPYCCFPIFLMLSFSPWPLLLPHAVFYVFLVCVLLDQSPSQTHSLIHEYGVTHVKCVDGILSFSGELCDVLHSCVTVMYYK